MNPRISDYFGAWAIESSYAARLWDVSRGVLANLPAHLAANSERVARLNGPIKPELVRVDGGLFEEDGESIAGVSSSPIIAVIDLRGCLMKSVGSMEEGTSTVRARQAIAAAAADSAISSIVLRIDSPGGTVAGTADLAAAVLKARSAKPVHAFVEDLCASAAYWVASQCDSLVANHGTATIGSIGAVMYLEDHSKAAEMDGIRPVVIATGPLKAAGCPALPIDEAQTAYFQGLVDVSQSFFSAAVAAGRGLPLERVTPGAPGTLATGQVWRAEEAQALGLIDAVASWEDFLASLAAKTIPAEPQSNPKEPQRMNIFSKLFGVKDDAEAKAKLEAIEAEHTASLASAAKKLAEAEAKHADAMTAASAEFEARASAIIDGIVARKLTEAEAKAAIKTPAAELEAKLQNKAPAVPSLVKVKTDASEAEIRAAFEAETDQNKALAMLRANPFLAKKTQE